MSHFFYEGEVYHKRFAPKKHSFTYPFFMLGVDPALLEGLSIRLFGLNRFNLFSFYAKDHFGKTDDFRANIDALLATFGLDTPQKMRFFTLPRIVHYVFNPISILVLFEEEKPYFMLVEVHNYNGGRVVYPVPLHVKTPTQYTGNAPKDMYVSPFLKKEGLYAFTLEYGEENIAFSIVLHEENQKILMASFRGKAKAFTTKTIVRLLCTHTLLTFWVVTRTLYQTLRLYLKGLAWNSVTPQDQLKRY